MTTSYPAAVDDFTNPTPGGEGVGSNMDDTVGGRTHAEMHADINDAVEAIQTELGTDPAGSEATVKARIAAAETAHSGHIADTSDAHDASAISVTPTGGIAATDVQAALAELDTDKQPTDSDLTAIAALTTTSFGRSLLEATDAPALRALVGASSETATGVVELATTTEAATGTDTARAVTPAGVQASRDKAGRLTTVAASGATETLTLAGPDDTFDVTMDQSCTFTFTSPGAGAWAFTLILRGAFTPSWPASVDWPNGTAPTYATPSVFTFLTVDSGTTWLGFLAGAALA